MTEKHLKDLANEIESSLQSGAVSDKDRRVLTQVQSELEAALAAPTPQATSGGLRDRLSHAIERLEGEHPRLTDLLSNALDALSDVGI